MGISFHMWHSTQDKCGREDDYEYESSYELRQENIGKEVILVQESAYALEKNAKSKPKKLMICASIRERKTKTYHFHFHGQKIIGRRKIFIQKLSLGKTTLVRSAVGGTYSELIWVNAFIKISRSNGSLVPISTLCIK